MSLQDFTTSLFDWSTQPKLASDQHFWISATLTVHSVPSASTAPIPSYAFVGVATLEGVRSGNGGAEPGNETGKSYLTGVVSPAVPGSPISYSFSMRDDGQLTVGMLVEGKRFLGRAPVSFMPAITDGNLVHALLLRPAQPASGTVYHDTMITVTFIKISAFVPV